jgi:4-hydroxy-4-methyl-2-oxoglutarate aldolase
MALCHPGDNWMIHVAVEVLQPVDVLVVACSSASTDGAFGELLATSLKARGAKGVVLDTGCRDANALTRMAFPISSRAISAKGTVT